MTATFAKAPVDCYIPCPQCKKMHLNVEKATAKGTIYCPVSCTHADITDYHKILSGLYDINKVAYAYVFIQLLSIADQADISIVCHEDR